MQERRSKLTTAHFPMCVLVTFKVVALASSSKIAVADNLRKSKNKEEQSLEP